MSRFRVSCALAYVVESDVIERDTAQFYHVRQRPIGVVSCAGFSVLHSRRLREREMESLRQRMARDLHDEIGSHLGSIRLMSELALRDGRDADSLEEIHRLAGEAAEAMRGIIWLVRKGDATKLSSLVEAMRQSTCIFASKTMAAASMPMPKKKSLTASPSVFTSLMPICAAFARLQFSGHGGCKIALSLT